MYGSKVAGRLRERIGVFSGEVSAGLGKVAKRFVGEMIYGLQAGQSVMLTDIGRTLEEPTHIKKVEERLSRNLQRRGLGDRVQENVLRMAAKHVSNETIIVIDPSDLSKKYAEKMEYLAWVRDGSEKELSRGYWTLHIIGTELDDERIIPLYQRLYSCESPEFESENKEILRAIDQVREATANRGLWVMDRGGDRGELFHPILDRKMAFLFRLLGNRHLLCGRRKEAALQLALTCPCPYTETIMKEEDGKLKHYHLSFGFRSVRLPERQEELFLLVVRGFGEQPLMLLTNRHLSRSRRTLWPMVQAYMRRWGVEETIRFVKQSYQMENVRVLNYQGLQNLMPLLLAVMYFASCVLDMQEKLKVMARYVLSRAKRLFAIADFRYYAIADGLKALLSRYPGRPKPPNPSPDLQPLLFSLHTQT